MSDVIKEFLVALGFKVDEAGMQKFIGGIEKATKQVATFAAGVEAMAAAVFLGVSEAAHELDKLNDLSNRIKVPVEEIEEMGYVAQIAGGSVEGAQQSLEGLAKAAGLASIGLGRAKKVFAELHINLKDSNGRLRDTISLMDEIGEKIKGLERGQQLAILSRLGIDPKMLESMTTDISGLRKEFEELQRATGFNANKAAHDAGKFIDAYDKIKFAIATIGKAISAQFFERLTNGMDNLRKMIVDAAPEIINAIEPILTTILDIADGFFQFAQVIVRDVQVVIEWFGRINQATDGLSNYILAAAAAWRIFNLGFLLTPVGLILTATAAIVALLDDVRAFAEGGKSLFDWSAVMPLLSAIAKIFQIIGTTIAFIIHLLTFQWTAALQDSAETWNLFKGGLKDLWHFDGNMSRLAGKAVRGEEISVFSQPQYNPLGSSGGSYSQNINQQTEIIIHGNDDPRATGQAVADHQQLINGDMLRNSKTNFVGLGNVIK